jgi:hypothetical protein
MTIVTTTYRYKRPPKQRKAVALKRRCLRADNQDGLSVNLDG